MFKVLARFPQTRGILVIASGINELDASGGEKTRELTARLREENVFPNKETAIATAHQRYDLAPA